MAFYNLLSICVLITALATGDCFLSNLMNEPLNLAVSLLDGQARNEANHPTTESVRTPGPITLTGNAGTTLSATPGGLSEYKEIVAKKLASYISGASEISDVPKEEATRDSSVSPSSEERSSKITWKHVRPAPKRPSKKPYNQRIEATLSTGRGHSSHVRINARPAVSKADHKLRQSGWKQSSWVANRSSRSGETYPVVTAKQAKGVGRSSSSSEENIIIVKKTAKSANQLDGSSKKSDWKKSSWVARSGSDEQYPVVTAKLTRGVDSSSSSLEENIIIVEKTKPANELVGSSKKSGWKKSSWVINGSSGSDENYPVVTAKQAKGDDSTSSSSEENIIIVKKTAKPAHSLRAAGGYKSNRRLSPRFRSSGLCDWCSGVY